MIGGRGHDPEADRPCCRVTPGAVAGGRRRGLPEGSGCREGLGASPFLPAGLPGECEAAGRCGTSAGSTPAGTSVGSGCPWAGPGRGAAGFPAAGRAALGPFSPAVPSFPGRGARAVPGARPGGAAGATVGEGRADSGPLLGHLSLGRPSAHRPPWPPGPGRPS